MSNSELGETIYIICECQYMYFIIDCLTQSSYPKPVNFVGTSNFCFVFLKVLYKNKFQGFDRTSKLKFPFQGLAQALDH